MRLPEPPAGVGFGLRPPCRQQLPPNVGVNGAIACRRLDIDGTGEVVQPVARRATGTRQRPHRAAQDAAKHGCCADGGECARKVLPRIQRLPSARYGPTCSAASAEDTSTGKARRTLPSDHAPDAEARAPERATDDIHAGFFCGPGRIGLLEHQLLQGRAAATGKQAGESALGVAASPQCRPRAAADGNEIDRIKDSCGDGRDRAERPSGRQCLAVVTGGANSLRRPVVLVAMSDGDELRQVRTQRRVLVGGRDRVERRIVHAATKRHAVAQQADEADILAGRRPDRIEDAGGLPCGTGCPPAPPRSEVAVRHADRATIQHDGIRPHRILREPVGVLQDPQRTGGALLVPEVDLADRGRPPEPLRQPVAHVAQVAGASVGVAGRVVLVTAAVLVPRRVDELEQPAGRRAGILRAWVQAGFKPGDSERLIGVDAVSRGGAAHNALDVCRRSEPRREVRPLRQVAGVGKLPLDLVCARHQGWAMPAPGAYAPGSMRRVRSSCIFCTSAAWVSAGVGGAGRKRNWLPSAS